MRTLGELRAALVANDELRRSGTLSREELIDNAVVYMALLEKYDALLAEQGEAQ